MRIELSDIPWAYHFPRPNWIVIREWILKNVSESEQPAAWDDAAMQWLEALDTALGGGYQVVIAEHFLFFLPDGHEQRRHIADFGEMLHTQISLKLQHVGKKNWPGRLPVLLFGTDEAYFEYKSTYFQAGEYGSSGAACMRDEDYVHIIVRGLNPESMQPAFAHELTHAFVSHLDLPQWLEEGLTQYVEDGFRSPWSQFALDAKSAKELREYWRLHGFANFWWEAGFYLPDEGQKHSYALSATLMKILIQDDKPQLNEFLREARRADAGESSAMATLGLSLSQLASEFLGAGDWTPVPPDAATFVRRAQFHWARKVFDEAKHDVERALQLDPQCGMAYELRGHLFGRDGQPSDAKADYDRALKLDPRNYNAMNALAWLLATSSDEVIRDGKRAVELAVKVCERTSFEEWAFLDTLAAAHAEAGEFDEAVTFQEDVVSRCYESDRAGAEQRLALYRDGMPYRETRSRTS